MVGRLEGARIPSRHLTVTFNVPQRLMRIYKLIAGLPYPKFVVRPAQRELDEFIHILEAGAVTGRRPAVTDFSVTYKTPHWKSKGFCAACPRDGLLVVGDEIIETPMAWRSRYFEVDATARCSRSTRRQGPSGSPRLARRWSMRFTTTTIASPRRESRSLSS